jgi:hypothetical protein
MKCPKCNTDMNSYSNTTNTWYCELCDIDVFDKARIMCSEDNKENMLEDGKLYIEDGELIKVLPKYKIGDEVCVVDRKHPLMLESGFVVDVDHLHARVEISGMKIWLNKDQIAYENGD